ncbi:MFS transporter [Roseibium polysiphoniae]|uniref:MFS transporter n=1 Tax=Roseibium polysiphoniae TaxID=2571221 RepID=UPI003297FDBD
MSEIVEKADRSNNRVIMAACAMMFIISLDFTIANVALPAIRDEMNVPTNMLGLALIAYSLPFATLMLSAGALTDRFGPVEVCTSGLIILGLGSLIGTAAPSFEILLLGRFVQGVGAALCMPSSLAMLRSNVPPDRLTSSIALWTLSGSVAISAGPILSGILVQYATWRSIFAINLPIVALAALMLFPLARSVRQGSASQTASLDIMGQALFILASVLLLGGLTLLQDDAYAFPRNAALTLLFFSAVTTFAFFWHEWRTVAPVMPPQLLQKGAFQSATLVGGAVSFVSFGAVYCLGLYYGIAKEFSPLVVGWLFLPSMLATVAGTSVVAGVKKRLGSRKTVLLGIASQLIGSLLICLQPDNVAWVSASASFLGFGIGLVIPAITSNLLSSLGANLAGVASGAFSSVRQFAAALGISVLGLLISGNATAMVADLQRVSAVCAALLAAVLLHSAINRSPKTEKRS